MKATGFKATGFKTSSAQTLNSIPGLKLYIDPNQSITVLGGGGLVTSMQDLSGVGNTLFGGASAPTVATDGSGFKYMNFVSARFIAVNSASAFNFLHNGSPHGIFVICRDENVATNKVSAIVQTANPETNTIGSIVFINNSTPNVQKIGHQISKGVAGNTVITTTSANNALAAATNKLIQLKYNGFGATGNDSTLYVNTTISVTADSSANTPVSTNSQAPFRISSTSNSPAYYFVGRVYLVLVYDWTGKTPTEIEDYRQTIEGLIYNQFGTIIV